MNQISLAIARVDDFRLHPLGFFYLLNKQDSWITHRVHVWSSASETKLEFDRHQHSFDIDSKLWAGRMHSEIFRFTETQLGGEQEFEVTYENGKSLLQSTGRRGVLEPTCAFESSRGDSYFLRSGVIHRVTILECPCVTTLVATERSMPIYSYGNATGEPPFERRLVNKNESAEIATILREL